MRQGRNGSTIGCSWNLLARPGSARTAGLDFARRDPLRSQRGFTLVETTIALGLLAAIVIATVIGLTHRGGSFETSREQVVAFLVMAKARAATNGDAAGNTGATVVASYAPPPVDATTFSLYEGRPFGGRLTGAVPAIAPLVVQGRLDLGTVTNGSGPSDVAIFIGASGATSALRGYVVNRTTVSAEPACIYAEGVRLPFSNGTTSHVITLSCATGEVVPDPSAPVEQRNGGTGGGSRTSGTND